MKRQTHFGFWFLVLFVVAADYACPRRPDCPSGSAVCAEGSTRCNERLNRSEVCHAGCFYQTDPIGTGECPAESVCCRTRAPYDAGVIFACTTERRCLDARDAGHE